jgi:hypothetical protein
MLVGILIVSDVSAGAGSRLITEVSADHIDFLPTEPLDNGLDRPFLNEPIFYRRRLLLATVVAEPLPNQLDNGEFSDHLVVSGQHTFSMVFLSTPSASSSSARMNWSRIWIAKRSWSCRARSR